MKQEITIDVAFKFWYCDHYDFHYGYWSRVNEAVEIETPEKTVTTRVTFRNLNPWYLLARKMAKN